MGASSVSFFGEHVPAAKNSCSQQDSELYPYPPIFRGVELLASLLEHLGRSGNGHHLWNFDVPDQRGEISGCVPDRR